MRSEKLKQYSVVAVFLLVTLIFFRKVIFTGREIVLSSVNCDTALSYFWWREFAFQVLKKGVLPLWNPYVFCGQPFIAGLQSAVFYLPNLIFFLLPVYSAINYTFILHILFSGLTTYLFVRYLGIDRFSALLSGIVFVFSALYLLHIYAGHLSDICALSWVPLLFLLLEKSIRNRRGVYFLLAGIILAMQILAGHPQYVFYTLVGLTLYFLIRILTYAFKRRIGPGGITWFISMFVLFVLIGFSLAAVQLFPALEMVKTSIRGGNLGFQWCGLFSFPPENLITFIIPGFFGDLTTVAYWGRWYLWETCGYIGILPLILCLISLIFRNRNEFVFTFGFIAAAALILSFGKYTPLFSFLYRFMPGFNLFRGNAKFIFLTVFSFAVLCGFGSNFLIENRDVRTRIRLKRLIGALFILSFLFILGIQFLIFKDKGGLGLWWGLVGELFSLGERYTDFSHFLSSGLSGILLCVWRGAWIFILFLIFTVYLFFLWIRNKIGLTWFKTLIFLTVFIDLLIFGSRYIVAFNPQTLRLPESVRKFLKLDPGLFRVGSTTPILLNQGITDGIFNLGGYEPNIIKRYSEFINFSQGFPLDFPQLVVTLNRYSGLLDLLNLKYILTASDSSLNIENFKLVFKNDRIDIYEDTNCLPRVFIAPRAKVIKEKEKILSYMVSDEFDPKKEVILEEDLPFPQIHSPSVGYRVPQIIDYQPNAIKLKVDLAEPGWLALSEVWFPGWKVYIDGKDDRIYRVDYILRGVYLDKGSHSVEFVYQPPALKLGLIISLSTLFLLLMIFIIRFIQLRIK